MAFAVVPRRLPRSRRHGAEHVPGVRGDQPQPGRRDLKLRRHEAVDFRLVVVLANRLDREAPFEVLALEWAQAP